MANSNNLNKISIHYKLKNGFAQRNDFLYLTLKIQYKNIIITIYQNPDKIGFYMYVNNSRINTVDMTNPIYKVQQQLNYLYDIITSYFTQNIVKSNWSGCRVNYTISFRLYNYNSCFNSIKNSSIKCFYKCFYKLAVPATGDNPDNVIYDNRFGLYSYINNCRLFNSSFDDLLKLFPITYTFTRDVLLIVQTINNSNKTIIKTWINLYQ